LQAYRHSLQPSDAETRPEYFSCLDCLPPPAKRVDAAGRPSMAPEPRRQRERLCVLPGFDCSTHPTAPVVKRVWMGRGRDHVNAGKTPDWSAPNEPVAEMGCPGAWYRTAFMRSLDRYYRRRVEGGARIENPALSRCDDTLVLEAVQMLEAFEDAAHGEYMRLFYADQKRKAAKP
jgi:hypothetical protein